MKVAVCVALAAFFLSVCGCTVMVGKISSKDIASITVTKYGAEEKISVSASAEQIKAFAEAYNTAAPLRNDVGTTHPLCAEVRFKNGSVHYVCGGVGGFITVVVGSRAQNVKCGELGMWFDNLHLMETP